MASTIDRIDAMDNTVMQKEAQQQEVQIAVDRAESEAHQQAQEPQQQVAAAYQMENEMKIQQNPLEGSSCHAIVESQKPLPPKELPHKVDFAPHPHKSVTPAPRFKTEVWIEQSVAKLSASCRFLSDENDEGVGSRSEDAEDQLAIFHRSEVNVCTLRGSGAFSEVYQVWGFTPYDGLEGVDPMQEHKRDEVMMNAIDENGKCRYVMKHIRGGLQSHRKKFVHAAADLCLEAKFLARLSHPNIIKIRGWAGGPMAYAEGTHDGFHILLDSVDETLSQRLVRWIMDESSLSPHGPAPRSMKNTLAAYKEKLGYAGQMARALEYLHDRDIIFRDLKPDNIGFKGNTLKIFDFGLCRELPEESPEPEKVFHMSGVGTRIFMAPEVLIGAHYNLKADVYSWTMVVHAMLSLQKPFAGYDPQTHKILCCEHGIRPEVFSEWPTEMQALCKAGWAQSPLDRPSIKEMANQVQDILDVLESGGERRVTQSHGASSAAPGVLGALNNWVDACQFNLCVEDAGMTKKAATLLRVLEMQMMAGGTTSVRHQRAADFPHLQHLRSAYL